MWSILATAPDLAADAGMSFRDVALAIIALLTPMAVVLILAKKALPWARELVLGEPAYRGADGWYRGSGSGDLGEGFDGGSSNRVGAGGDEWGNPEGWDVKHWGDFDDYERPMASDGSGPAVWRKDYKGNYGWFDDDGSYEKEW